MSNTPKHSVSVAGVVLDEDGNVLVIQRRDNGKWEPPGGVLELEESPQEGVSREILEETGVSVEVISLSGVYKNMTHGIISLVFKCRPKSGTPGPTTETVQTKWMPMKDAARSMDEAFAIRITDALKEQVPVTSHNGLKVTPTASSSEEAL